MCNPGLQVPEAQTLLPNNFKRVPSLQAVFEGGAPENQQAHVMCPLALIYCFHSNLGGNSIFKVQALPYFTQVSSALLPKNMITHPQPVFLLLPAALPLSHLLTLWAIPLLSTLELTENAEGWSLLFGPTLSGCQQHLSSSTFAIQHDLRSLQIFHMQILITVASPPRSQSNKLPCLLPHP